MRIAFLGFGLIAGSLAMALRRSQAAPAPTDEAGVEQAGPITLVAWSPSGDGPARARSEGVVDAAPERPDEAIAGADLVILAAPPVRCLELIERLRGELLPALAPGATVTDVASTKARIAKAADAARLRFVGGHPMAGREQAGYAAAIPDLFVDRPWVVVPGQLAAPADVERVEWLARASGARPVRLEADEHDRAVAAISHLPLVLSAALVEAVVGGPDRPPRPDWRVASELAASGWRDMTRLAKGDVDMGVGIALTNAGPLTERLRDVRDVLDAWIADLEMGAGVPADDQTSAARTPADSSVEAAAERLRRRLVAARDRLTRP